MASSPSWELFVPGRLCLFGEHTDWAAAYAAHAPTIPRGLALVTGTTQGLYARVRRVQRTADDGAAVSHTHAVVRYRGVLPQASRAASTGTHEQEAVEAAEAVEAEWPLDATHLVATARSGGVLSYVAGTVAVVLERHPQVRASMTAGEIVHIENYRTTLPVRKGLSSSAATCVLVTRAFNLAFQLGLSVHDEMELAFLGETTTPSRCGRLDQACAFGTRPSLLEFHGHTINASPVKIRGSAHADNGADPALHLIIVDLGAGKDTKEILARLNECYPAPSTPVHEQVHLYLGDLSPKLTQRALAAIEASDAAALGALMTESQALFDQHVAPACPHELTSPVLHRLLEHPPLRPLVYGGKGVGSQGDGTAQLVARSAQAQTEAMALIERDFPRMHCLPLTLHPHGADH